MPKRTQDPRIQINLTLNLSTLSKLQKIAEKEKDSVSAIAEKFIIQQLESRKKKN